VPGTNADAGIGARLAPPVPGDDVSSELDRVAAAGIAKIDAENFPVALRLLPNGPRADLTRIYAFARFVDDVGDASIGDRHALLDSVERDVRRLALGAARLAPVQGMQELIRARGLTVEPMLDLVEANRRDQDVTRYETFDDLLEYCRLSAAPIGRMVLAVAGVADDESVRRSDRVCAALQVLEHCQDVGEDAAMGRVYLPAAELRAARVTDRDLAAKHTSAALRRVIGRQVGRSEQLLADGRPLVGGLRGWSRLAVLGYVAGGRATAARLRKGDYDVLARHLGPRPLGTAWQALLVRIGR
jgi:squalene synthase HpnC